MPLPRRSRIRLPENTSDNPAVIRRAQAAVRGLRASGFVSNPHDRAEMMYGKGAGTFLGGPARIGQPIREASSSLRIKKKTSTPPRRRKPMKRVSRSRKVY